MTFGVDILARALFPDILYSSVAFLYSIGGIEYLTGGLSGFLLSIEEVILFYHTWKP